MLYIDLARTYEKLEATTLKLKKARIVSDFLAKAPESELDRVCYLILGRVFPGWSESELGVASLLMAKALAKTYGVKPKDIEKDWKKLGDLGIIAEKRSEEKKQARLLKTPLTVEKVFASLRKLPFLEGAGSQEKKRLIISELLSSAEPVEAKYICRTIIGDLRVGVAEGIVRDAIARAFFSKILWRQLLWQAAKGKKRYERLIENSSKNRRPKSFLISKELFGAIEESISQGALKSLEPFMKANQVQIKPESEIASAASFWKRGGAPDFVLIEDAASGNRLKERIISKIDEALEVSNDYGEVAKIAGKKGEAGLESIELTIGRPIKVMLAQKVADIKEAFETVGSPAAIEYKYDGFRMQIHKKSCKSIEIIESIERIESIESSACVSESISESAAGEKSGANPEEKTEIKNGAKTGIEAEIKIFTRRLENVTAQFPEIVEEIKKSITAESCIIEGEAVGFDRRTKKYLPFQQVSRRIRRKYGIEETAQEIPIILNLFDIIYLNGKSIIKTPFADRRAALDSIVKPGREKIVLAKQLLTASQSAAEKFYAESLERGNEGVMFKSVDAPYKPGSRVGYMVKLKPTMESLDLVIVGGEWGEGKRSGWLSSFILACFDRETGEFKEIGRLGTGIKEKQEKPEKQSAVSEEAAGPAKDAVSETAAGKEKIEAVSFSELTQMLKDSIIKEEGKVVTVTPSIVAEVAYEEIQKSPTYNSGYALRFPRLLRIRSDRSPKEADDIARVEELFKAQRRRSEEFRNASVA